MTATHAIVIGAGPAGLTAAYELCKRGVHVDVVEAGPAIGGLARSIELWGWTVEFGSHIFISHDRRVSAIWTELVGNDYRRLTLRRGIYTPRHIFGYPLALGDVVRNLGPIDALRCLVSFAFSRFGGPPRGQLSAEAWIVSRFGRRVFDLFFRDYAEKLFGLPAHQVDAKFALELLGNLDRISPWDYVRKRLVRAQGDRSGAGHAQFAHPDSGIGVLWTRMAERVHAMGGHIHLGTRVQRLVTSGAAVTGVEVAGAVRPCDLVVSSLPLPVLVRALSPGPRNVEVAAQSLALRNTVLVYLRVDSPDLFPYNWLYIYAPAIRIGRVTNFRCWASDSPPDDASILCLEYWCSDADAVWQSDDAGIVELAAREMRATGLLGEARISATDVRRFRGSHPVYSKGYLEHVGTLRDYVGGFTGLVSIGRHGSFSNNSVSDSILNAILAVDRALYPGGAAHERSDASPAPAHRQ